MEEQNKDRNSKIANLVQAMNPVLKAMESDDTNALKDAFSKNKDLLKSAFGNLSREDIIGTLQDVIKDNGMQNVNAGEAVGQAASAVQESKVFEAEGDSELTMEDVVYELFATLIDTESSDYYDETIIDNFVKTEDDIELLRQIVKTPSFELANVAKRAAQQVFEEEGIDGSIDTQTIREFTTDIVNAIGRVLKDYDNAQDDIDDGTDTEYPNEENDDESSEYNLGQM